MFSHLPEPGRTGLCVSTENYRRHKISSKVKTIIITIDESLIFSSQIKAIFKKSKSKIRFFLSLYHTKQQCTIMQGKNNITVESLPRVLTLCSAWWTTWVIFTGNVKLCFWRFSFHQRNSQLLTTKNYEIINRIASFIMYFLFKFRMNECNFRN